MGTSARRRVKLSMVLADHPATIVSSQVLAVAVTHAI